MTALEFALGMRRACRLQQRVTDLQLDVLLGLAYGIRSVRGLADYFFGADEWGIACDE